MFYDIRVFQTITQTWQYWHYYQLCIPTDFQFLFLFAPTGVNKCEIRNQKVHEDYITRLYTSFDGIVDF